MPSFFGILDVIDFESSFISSDWSFSLLRWCDPGLAGLSGLTGQVSLLFVACIVAIVVGGGFDAIGGGDDVTTLDSIELHSTKVFSYIQIIKYE